jgi:hypothetical protein
VIGNSSILPLSLADRPFQQRFATPGLRIELKLYDGH